MLAFKPTGHPLFGKDLLQTNNPVPTASVTDWGSTVLPHANLSANTMAY